MIEFVDPTPANNSVNTTGSVLINTSVSNATNGTAFINWNNSLIGWWRMNEEAGDILVQDFSGNGNNGTWNGNTTSNITDGRFGNALIFDGTNDHVNINNSDSLNLSDQDFSISFWANGSDSASGMSIISNSKFFANKGWHISSGYSPADYIFQIANETTSRSVRFYTGVNWNGYNHFVVTKSDSLLNAYVNGSLVASSTNIITDNINNNSLSINIGRSATGTNYFKGDVDDIIIFNRVLGSDEIQSLYNSSNQLNHTVSSLNNGNYSYLAYIQNETGIINNTETRFINVNAVCNADIVFSSGNISISGNGFANLSCIDSKINNSAVFNRSGNDYISFANITITDTNTYFYNNDSAILRLNGTHYFDSIGKINISYLTVTSWNNVTNSVIDSYSNRGNIYLHNNLGIVTINNSNISYLGINSGDYTEWGGLTLVYSADSNIINSEFKNNFYGVYIVHSDRTIIRNNSLENSRKGILSELSKDVEIDSNYVYNGTSHAISVYSSSVDSYLSMNNTVKFNTINLTDIGIYVSRSVNTTLYSNTIINSTKNYDTYQLGIFLFRNVSIVNITNNTISNGGTGGIYGHLNVSDVIIKNNNISLTNINTAYSSTDELDINEPRFGIAFLTIYKGFVSDSSASDHDNVSFLVPKYISRNISIQNNIFGTDVQVPLYLIDADNVSHDMSNVYEVNLSFPRLFYYTKYYISNNYSTMNHIAINGNRTGNYGYVPWIKELSNIFQIVYTHPYGVMGTEVFMELLLEKQNITIYPKAFEYYNNNTYKNLTDTPYDFYLYSPAFTPFSSKSSTIFSNGTTYIQLYNDTLEPSGYHTTNITAVPASGSVIMNVTEFNSSAFNFTANATDGDNVNFTVGGRTSGRMYQIKKDGVNFKAVASNASGYITFNNSEWTEHTFTGEDAGINSNILSIVSPASYFVASSGVAVNFITSSTQEIDTYSWTVDGMAVSGTDTYSTSWSRGLHHINVYGTNENGTTNTLEWRASVARIMTVAPIPTVNESNFELIKNATRNKELENFLDYSLLPYKDSLGDMFWLFVWLMIFVAFWIRTGKMTFPTIIALVFGAIFIAMIPEEYQMFAKAMIAVGILVVVLLMFTKRGEP